MQRTLKKLESIVDQQNDASLLALKRDQPWLASSLPNYTAGVAGIVSKFPSNGCPVFNGIRKGKSWNATNSQKFLTDSVALDPHGVINAVFSVIDDSGPNQDESLDVALCVGINYGQGLSHLNQPLLEPQDLKMMRKHLQNAVVALGGNSGQKPKPPIFHLVAANFFPWISKNSWSSSVSNLIDESIVMKYCGYSDPVGVIASLVKVVEPKWLVFHGASNCVSSLGLEVLYHTSHISAMLGILSDT